jgi:hypothetical protein
MSRALLPLLVLVIGCAHARSRGMDPARESIIRAVEDLFAGMRARDTTALRRLLTPEAHFTSAVYAEGRTVIRSQSVDAFIASIARPGPPLVERMWDPEARIDGDVASVWAPYDFHIGNTFSHCGHDGFQLVRRDGAWRISAITSTVRTDDDCRDIRHPDSR